MADSQPGYGSDDGKAAPVDTGLEVPKWRLGLRGEGADAALPERPGQPDCGYFLKTGGCGYGDQCRYNHPRDRGAAFTGGWQAIGSYFPERLGQPLCEYYLKHGTCKFGANCKYHHPREGSGSMRPVILNSVGYPARPGAKECAYYVKTGQCKFGYTCKFHHPELGTVPMQSPAIRVYPPVQSSSPISYPPLASWQVGRSAVVPGTFISGPYSHMIVSPGAIPLQAWTYAPPMNSGMPASSQQAVQVGPLYGVPHQGSPSGVGYTRPCISLSSSRPSSCDERENLFPERPGQPDCQYYIRTGDCKFGETCKYHHPRDSSVTKSNCFLSPLGLPIRPDAQPCSYYAQYGFCRFGRTCKFDHPWGSISYSPSASSLTEMAVAPYPQSSLMARFNSSSSAPELGRKYLLTQEASTKLAQTSDSASASVVSKGLHASQAPIFSQTPTTDGNGNTTHA